VTFRSNIAVILLAVVLAALLSACAGTARGTKSTAFAGGENVEVTDFSLTRADALVVIRYPAIIHEDAQEPYFHAFSINAIGGEVPPANRTKKVTTRIAQSVIAKSSYYVMSLYRELQRELPENTVLLSPHIVLWDRETGLYSRPILASEQVPSVLTIDFNVYSFPDPTELMDSPPVTFGDLVTPLVTIHSNRWMQPATNGLILASDPLVRASWDLSNEAAVHDVESKFNFRTPSWQRELDFVHFLTSRDNDSGSLPSKGLNVARGELKAVELYPVEKILLNGALLENLSTDPTPDPFVESFVRNASGSIKLMLNSVNLTLVAFNRMHGGDQNGQILAFFIIAIAAAEAAVGLAIVLAFFRLRGSVRSDEANSLKN